jgi:hypothetical protein
MSIVDVQIRTITCNNCDKTVTFNTKDHQQVVIDNPWLNASRVVQTGDGRNFVYCSDECEVVGIGTGSHNIPEKKQVAEVTGGDAAIKMAALQAQAAEEATRAIKGGKPSKLQIVRS